MDSLLLTPEILLLLLLVALVAGCIDTLAGGGGLITLPALMLAGVPPLQALGTNKLQGCMGTATATALMLRHGRVRWKEVQLPMASAFVAAACGSGLVQLLDTSRLDVVIPLVLLAIAAYFLASGKLLEQVHPVRMPPLLFRSTVVPMIGLYDGMFGPGTGSFYSLAGVALQGQPLLQATAVAKTLNFATNFASLLVFLLGGLVVWQAGLVMMLGQLCGAWIGSHLLFRIPVLWLRGLVVLMCLGMLTRWLLA
ncbi:MAG: TSUP family transporter [Pseudohongiellaceae bacterium]|jgi:hypothetical protein